MDRDEPLDRSEILVLLNRIEDATRPAPPAKFALFADFLVKDRITGGELADALRGALREWRSACFPPLPKILEWARPSATNQPRRDEPTREFDPIAHMEREIDIHTQWLRKFELRGDDYHAKCARADIARLQDRINARRESQGRGPQYVGVGVEDFSGRSEANRPVQADFRDWTRNDED